MRPVLHVPRHPVRLAALRTAGGDARVAARAGLSDSSRRAPCSAAVAAHAFSPLSPSDELLGGHGAHLRRPPLRLAGRARRVARDHRRPRRRRARARRAASRPGAACARCPSSRAADAVVLDLAPGAVADIAGDRLPPRVARAYRRYRHGPGAFKVDLAVAGGVPWTNEACPAGRHRARGRLLRGDRRSPSARSTAAACPSARSCSSVSSTLADPERPRKDDVHPVWAYAHVPNGYTGDATEAAARPDRAVRAGTARADRRDRACARPAEIERRQRQLRRRRHHHRRQHAAADRGPPASGDRSLQHRHPRCVHLLGGDAAGRRRARDERLQRRAVGAQFG